MSSKALFYSNLFAVTILLFIGMSCGALHKNGNNSGNNSSQPNLQSSFKLFQQKAPPSEIQSIQLHPKGNPTGPPILQLDSQKKLVLSFDYLGEQSQQFRLQISHRTQNWARSAITPSTYVAGFSKTYIQNAKESFSERPSYWHVEYEFPGNIAPKVSGNYLMEVYGYNEGKLLFSVPFFVSENQGVLDTSIEELFAQRNDGRPLHQLFSTYRYPNFVEYPQFDLSMSFVQNRFWGRMQKADFLDTITPGKLVGRLSRNKAFIGNYSFKVLDLRSFTPDGRQILDHHPGQTPPKIILRRDSQTLDTQPRFHPPSNFGRPLSTRDSDYARVKFSLETSSTISPSAKVYIVGHFNNWMINPFNKMSYNNEQKLWEGHALVKQGEYAYKYVIIHDNGIDDLSLDQSFVSAKQEYLTFIYFKDPNKHFDRLLKVNRLVR